MKTKGVFLSDYLVEIVLIVILFADLFIQVIPPVFFVSIIAICHIIRLDFNANALLFFYFLAQFIGASLNTIGISGYGGFAMVAGFFLVIYGIIKGKTRINNWQTGTFLIALLFFLFALSMLSSLGGDYAETKLSRTMYQGVKSLILFLVLFSNFDKIRKDLLGFYLMIYGVYLLRLSIVANDIPGPSGLFDFGFMKEQTREFLLDKDDYHINTHFPGLYFLQGLAILLMSKLKNDILVWFSLIIGLFTVLYSGSRQMIVAIAVMLIIWLMREKHVRGIASAALFVFLIPIVYVSSDLGDIFSSTVDSGYVEGGGRGPWLLQGIADFMSSPLYGIGFGRYNLEGDYTTYPHNLIIELLAEMGIIGTAIVLLIMIGSIWKNRASFSIAMYYFVALFLMSMASGGMYDNICVFALVFALPSLTGGIKSIKVSSKKFLR